jgi:membrane-bound metal-dependent hydrolase YbcI (DUF457 family)
MSNLADHDEAGIAAGAILSLVLALKSCARGEEWDVVAQVLGGAVGGKLGSRLPDLIEPPTSSWHRSAAHSLVATAAVATAGLAKSNGLAERLRVAARDARIRSDENPNVRAMQMVLRLLNSFGAGVATGIPAGYVSHTLLDAATPRSIPFITKGF